MRILITGANGYIGAGVVKLLVEYGFDVIASDTSLENVDCRADSIAGDLFEIENRFEYFGKPDVLLHLAWRDGFKHDSINHINDFSNHYNFLREMINSGLKQLCVLGSMHEVGFFEGCIDENTPTNPQSLYGISKNALRQSIELLLDQRDFILQWIRGYYIVGNTQNGNSVFSKIIQAERSGRQTFPFTLGNRQYDFLDYDEFCKQVAAVVVQNEVNGIINCCSGCPMKLGKRMEKFIKDNNLNIKLEYGVYPDRPYDSEAIWGSAKKINQILLNPIFGDRSIVQMTYDGDN